MNTYSIVGGTFPVDFKVGRGFATELSKSLLALQPASIDALLNDLLTTSDESGLSRYAKVAPQAAKLRPRRPVAWQLRQWADKGLVTVEKVEKVATEAATSAAPAENTAAPAEGAAAEPAAEVENAAEPAPAEPAPAETAPSAPISKSLAKKLAKAAARASQAA
jgi:hypothetical protein